VAIMGYTKYIQIILSVGFHISEDLDCGVLAYEIM